jgi:hypothetical protein
MGIGLPSKQFVPYGERSIYHIEYHKRCRSAREDPAAICPPAVGSGGVMREGTGKKEKFKKI